MTDTKRLYYLDNLRVAVIVLVIAHHVGQAYGPTGGWWPIQEAERAPLLGPFFTVNRSFFMSLFFMISGYFTVMSFRSKGAQNFLKDRALRLGIPALVFGLVMIPMQLFVFSSSAFPIDVGHLWFLEHLLIFSTGYVLWQTIRRNRVEMVQSQMNLPGYLTILIATWEPTSVLGSVLSVWQPSAHRSDFVLRNAQFETAMFDQTSIVIDFESLSVRFNRNLNIVKTQASANFHRFA